jgi:hypothetical protein
MKVLYFFVAFLLSMACHLSDILMAQELCHVSDDFDILSTSQMEPGIRMGRPRSEFPGAELNDGAFSRGVLEISIDKTTSSKMDYRWDVSWRFLFLPEEFLPWVPYPMPSTTYFFNQTLRLGKLTVRPAVNVTNLEHLPMPGLELYHVSPEDESGRRRYYIGISTILGIHGGMKAKAKIGSSGTLRTEIGLATFDAFTDWNSPTVHPYAGIGISTTDKTPRAILKHLVLTLINLPIIALRSLTNMG